MKLAFVCFCIFAVACFHDAVLLTIYDKKEVTFCFWDAERLTDGATHPSAASVLAVTLAQRCKVKFAGSFIACQQGSFCEIWATKVLTALRNTAVVLRAQ